MSEVTMDDVALMCDNCDCDEQLGDYLDELQAKARTERDFKLGMRIRRLKRRPNLMSKLETKIKDAVKEDIRVRGVMLTADGEILKYLVEWFTENWEVIIEFIKAIVAIF